MTHFKATDIEVIFCDFWAYLAYFGTFELILRALIPPIRSKQNEPKVVSIRCLKMSHVLQGPLYIPRPFTEMDLFFPEPPEPSPFVWHPQMDLIPKNRGPRTRGSKLVP